MRAAAMIAAMLATGRLDRRTFVGRSLAAAAALWAGGRAGAAAATAPPRVDALPGGVTRTWIGPTYWANRLADWRLNGGRIECLAAGMLGGRTVGVLTLGLLAGPGAATISVRTGTLATGPGFSAILVGAGGGLLDPRAAALVQQACGSGGGILCCYGNDGAVRFRNHGDEADGLGYPEITPTVRSGPAPARTPAEDVLLMLQVTSTAPGLCTLVLTASDHATGALRSAATLVGVDESRVTGGVSLMSSGLPLPSGARYWFRELRAGGVRAQLAPQRSLGPIAGVLYSLSGSVLKMTVQLFPVSAAEPQTVRLDVRRPGGAWTTAATAPMADGYDAGFRLSGWNGALDWEYRAVYAPGTASAQIVAGTIAADPASVPELVVGIVNCTIHSFRALDRYGGPPPRMPQERPLGAYTRDNLYFPYAEPVAALRTHDPHLLVALGDQYYENRPTSPDTSAAPRLDFLYRYYLWLWAIGDLTRDRPTVVLVDDHDVMQPNLWGHSGAAAPNRDADRGGYVKAPSLVNTIQRVQCGHNPDAYDPTPVQQGISVYYGMFSYGGVGFAMLEDRKFKTGDADGLDASGQPYPSSTAKLLGQQQEAFLAAWATTAPAGPRICLTQSLYACLQTAADGTLRSDYDSNGYPSAQRSSALKLIAQARALMVGGDQHLGSVVRHGISRFGDGPVQFTVPALGSSYQRWWEPAQKLPNATATPYTGDVVDAFGNRISVLAVANPLVSFADYRQYHQSGQALGDRALKREGYGIVRVQRAAGTFRIEAWPWDADPSDPGATQFPGWPVSVRFT